ncbi:hypothetical protein CCACVL1_25079, partial [Corchorus capsularis]
ISIHTESGMNTRIPSFRNPTSSAGAVAVRYDPISILLEPCVLHD